MRLTETAPAFNTAIQRQGQDLPQFNKQPEPKEEPMRTTLIFSILLLGALASACSYWSGKAPQITEVEPQLVSNCRLLGVLNETADADAVFQWRETEKMILRIKQRAVQLGATHLVWNHRSRFSASASAYLCPGTCSSSKSTSP